MQTTPSRRLIVPVVAVVVLGVFLRVLGYFDPALQLWFDEAIWARMLVDGTAAWIRPAGYMKLSGLIVSIANTEPMLRSLSLVAGIAMVALVAAVFRRTTTSAHAALFGVFLIAIHPAAVSMSKEFKPYAVEAMMHVALILLAMRWLAAHRRRDLVGFVVVAAGAPLLAWSVVFAYPGLFLLIGFDAWRARRLGDLAIAAAGGVVALGVLLAIFFLRVANTDAESDFWGQKYDVFYVGQDVVDGVRWALSKTFDVAGFPGRLATGMPEPLTTWLDAGLPIVAAIVTLAAAALLVARRRFTALIIWVLPWVLTGVFNAAGKWPYGVFRTNLFLLVYTTGIIVLGLDELATWRAWSTSTKRAATAALIAFSALVFPWNLDHFRVKEERSMALHTSVRTAIEQIAREAPAEGPVDLILDGHACGIFRYYTRLHRDTKAVLRPVFSSPRFRVVCGGFATPAWLTTVVDLRSEVAYVLIAKPPFEPLTRAALTPVCASIAETGLPGATLIFRCAVASRTPSGSAP